MATPVNPTTTEPGGALFRALRSVDVDPDLAYEAAEEVRRQAGENVIAVLRSPDQRTQGQDRHPK